MSPRTAYTIVALIGFILGVAIYVVAALVIPFLIDTLPMLAELFTRYQHVIGALVSGLVGSLVAIVLAYIWASRSEF